MALQWLPCQAPGVIGSVVGLIGPVSVYCDWVRWKVWSATSISAWQHVKLSVHIRPWDTLACCWDDKQATNQQTISGSSLASDFTFGTPVAALPGAWRYRVSARTGWPGVSTLWPGQKDSLIYNLSVWQQVQLSEQMRPWDTLACCWDVKQPTNNNIFQQRQATKKHPQYIFTSARARRHMFKCAFQSSSNSNRARMWVFGCHRFLLRVSVPLTSLSWLLHDFYLIEVHRLVGLVVKAPASRAEDPGFESRWRRDFSGSSHTSDLNIVTPVATLPGAWHYRVSAGTGRPGVSILWLGEVESSNYSSVWQHVQLSE